MRRKGGQQTVNLCNQFIVLYLEKRKKHFEKIGMERKSLVYYSAIQSIKKYPLPIICLQQLKILYGLGELLCDELIKVIKEHYSVFLKKGKEQSEGGEEGERGDIDEFQEKSQSLGGCKSTSVSGLHRKKEVKFRKEGEQGQIEDDSLSISSFRSATVNRPYKLKPNTQGAYILLIIHKHAESHFISKEMILDRFKEEYATKLTPRNLILILANLTKADYIQQNAEDSNLIKLAKKGQKQVDLLELRTKQKDSSVKVQSMLSSFMATHSERSKPMAPIVPKLTKRQVDYENEIQLELLIDTREIKDKQDQSFFQKKMTEKYGVRVRTCNLPIGDFMWSYDNQILDYVVQRKKADDLVGSIMDGRYKEQKFRLKNSGFSNVFYLFEGHLTGGFAKNGREVETALLNTRVKDKFKVTETNNITDSLKFLHFLTQEIKRKLVVEQRLPCLGTIEEVTALNGKSSQLTVQHIFGLSIKTIPRVGRQSTAQILRHFKSFRELYDKLSELSTTFERIEFMRCLLKGANVRSTVPELLVQVLFANEGAS